MSLCYDRIPNDILPFLKRRGNDYQPILYINEHWRRKVDHQLIYENTQNPAKLQVEFSVVTLGWFRLTLELGKSINNMKQSMFASSDKETDNIRELFFQVNPTLLACTFVASVLHLLFDSSTYMP